MEIRERDQTRGEPAGSEETVTRRLASQFIQELGGEGDQAPPAPLDPSLPNGTISLEGTLRYSLPSSRRVSHRTDILLSCPSAERYASIEVKHESAVTDQFKARSYDARHLKREHGDGLLAALVYVDAGEGISTGLAGDYAYPFDLYLGFPAEELSSSRRLDRLVDRLREHLEN